MFTRHASFVALVASALVFTVSPVFAQATGTEAEARAGAPALHHPGEVARLFDAYAVVQAQEMLQLDDATFAGFLGRLKTLQQARRRYQRGRAQIIQDLQRRLRVRDPDEAGLRERVEALAQHDAAGLGEIRKATDAIDEMLTVHQRARFRVFEHQLELRKLELVGRARQQIRTNRPRP